MNVWQTGTAKKQIQKRLNARKEGSEDAPFPLEIAEMEVGVVKSHFLDSGAFSQWDISQKYARENGCGRWDYYETKEFFAYIDAYAYFVKKYQKSIDLYANVDVIGNSELTWRNQRYLEKKHGLRPVPVVHCPEPIKWLERYINRGYEVIGLGGLVGKHMGNTRASWLDACFDLVCNTPDRLPRVKIHGFGMTTLPVMTRYPWWSVDHASWTKDAALGDIRVPHKRGGKFVFDEWPDSIPVSPYCIEARQPGKMHYLNLSPAEQGIVREWLRFIHIPLGKFGRDGRVIEWGVITHHIYRRTANLHFFDHLRRSLPAYPWPFRRPASLRGFGIVC